MSDNLVKIKRALISVSDKEGIVDFAGYLAKNGVEILSTGGTARALRDAGIAVHDVSEYTGYPEMMDGRVKTLHPKVHGALLARRDLSEHMEQCRSAEIQLIDMVVVNLYPFEKTVARDGVALPEAVEQIDIGGPSMVRSSAKNFSHVAVVTSPEQYSSLVKEMESSDGSLSLATRFTLAKAAFARTSEYDSAITAYLSETSL